MTDTSIFSPITTEAGHAARMAAVAGGFAVDISHIALGDRGYEVARNNVGRATATGLVREKDRVDIQDVRIVSPNQKDLSFIVDPVEDYWIREIGFYLSDGTLYAIASHPTLALDWATSTKRNLFALEFVIEDGDSDSIQILNTGPPLNLLMSKEFAILAAFQMTNALENLRQADQLKALTGAYPNV